MQRSNKQTNVCIIINWDKCFRLSGDELGDKKEPTEKGRGEYSGRGKSRSKEHESGKERCGSVRGTRGLRAWDTEIKVERGRGQTYQEGPC